MFASLSAGVREVFWGGPEKEGAQYWARTKSGHSEIAGAGAGAGSGVLNVAVVWLENYIRTSFIARSIIALAFLVFTVVYTCSTVEG